MTPVKNKTRKFIEVEKEENKNECSKISNSTNGETQRKPNSNPIPAGYELTNEVVLDFDGMELF